MADDLRTMMEAIYPKERVAAVWDKFGPDNTIDWERVNYKTDLHHVPTERLESLADRYKRRVMVSPNDQGLKMRIQFILSEIGMRQMVADIERDVEADSQ